MTGYFNDAICNNLCHQGELLGGITSWAWDYPLPFCFILGLIILILGYRTCRRFQNKYFNGKKVWSFQYSIIQAAKYPSDNR